MTEQFLIFSYIFIVGTCVGSFLNVVIYRLPANGSVVWPPSACPECACAIRWHDNIPIIGYLLLRGFCRDCGTFISPRYILLEIITGGVWLYTAMTFGLTPHALMVAIFVSGLIAITFIDIGWQIIPDEISIGGFFFALGAVWFLPHGIEEALVSAVCASGFFFFLALLYPGGMGGGDIKLMAAIGAFTGYKGTFITVLTGSTVGAVIGIVAIIFSKAGRRTKVPFGPFLAFGALVAIYFGDRLIDIYWKTIYLTP